MIISVWKPKTKYLNKKQVVILYDKVDIESIYKKGSSGYKVIWICDNEKCKTPFKIHSINRNHLSVNRSLKCNENIQICHSCQISGEGNPRYGDRRKWEDFFDYETLSEKKRLKSLQFKQCNPSKDELVKIKKNQFIVSFDNVKNILIKEDFNLIELEGDNKNSVLNISCPRGHLFSIKWHSWKSGHRCKYCFYESISIPFDVSEKFEKYQKLVRSLTLRNYRKFKHIIDPDNLRSKKYHLDHIYSVYDGFRNNVDPEILASPKNLRVIGSVENLKKGKKSIIDLDFLLEIN